MLVIHRKGKVLFTWIKWESDKWECLCSVHHMPFHSLFSLFSFLLSSVQGNASSARLVSPPFRLFYRHIAAIFSCTSCYFSAFSIRFHKNWQRRRKAKETPPPQKVFLLGVSSTCQKSVTVSDDLAPSENLTVHSYNYFNWRMCHTIMTHKR